MCVLLDASKLECIGTTGSCSTTYLAELSLHCTVPVCINAYTCGYVLANCNSQLLQHAEHSNLLLCMHSAADAMLYS